MINRPKRGRVFYVPRPVVDELERIQKTDGAKTLSEQWNKMTEYTRLGKSLRSFIALDMRKEVRRGKFLRK